MLSFLLIIKVIFNYNQGNINQKQSLIQTLYTPIDEYNKRISLLTKRIDQIQPIFKIQSQISNLTFFLQTSKTIKQKINNDGSLVLQSSLYVSIWIHFISFLIDQKCQQESIIEQLSKYTCQLIFKKTPIDNINTKDQLWSFLKNKPQFYFIIYGQDIRSLNQKELEKNQNFQRRNNIKKKTIINSSNNNSQPSKQINKQKPSTKTKNKPKQLYKHQFISSQVCKKILLLQYFQKKSDSPQIILIDPYKLLLQWFSLTPIKQIELYQSGSKKNKNQSKKLKKNCLYQAKSNIKAYFCQQSPFSFSDEDYCFLFVFINDNEWLLKSQIINQQQLKEKLSKRYLLTVGDCALETQVFISQKKKLSVFFVKQNYGNYDEKCIRYQIVSLGGSLQNHQKQLIELGFIKRTLPKQKIERIQQFHQNRNQHQFTITKNLLALPDYQHLIGQYFQQNIWIFQKQLNHVKMMHDIHKVICNNQNRFSIYETEYIKILNEKIEKWKFQYQDYMNLETSYLLYKQLVKSLYEEFIRKLLGIYKYTLKTIDQIDNWSELTPNKKVNKLNCTEIHKKILLSDFLRYITQASEYFYGKLDNYLGYNKDDEIIFQMKIIQNYLLYQLSNQQYANYFLANIYLYIYATQNNETSIIDLKNILHHNFISNQINSLINSKIGYNNIQKLKYLPGNKLQIQNFMRRLIKQLKNPYSKVLLQNKQSMKQFIQTFEYQSRYKKSSDLVQTQQKQSLKNFNHLNYFTKLLLKKMFIPEVFYDQIQQLSIQNYYKKQLLIEKVVAQKSVAQQINSQLIDFQYLSSHNKFYLYFGNPSYWINYIKDYYDQNGFKLQNIALIRVQNKQQSILQLSRQKNQNYSLQIIFDRRYELFKQNIIKNGYKTNQKKEQSKLIQKMCIQYLNFYQKDTIIFTSEQIHEHFHYYQINFIRNLFNNYNSTVRQKHQKKLNENLKHKELKMNKKEAHFKQKQQKYPNFICCSSKQILQKLNQEYYAINITALRSNALIKQIKQKQNETFIKRQKKRKKIFTVGSIIRDNHQVQTNQIQQKQQDISYLFNKVIQNMLCINDNLGYSFDGQFLLQVPKLYHQINKYCADKKSQLQIKKYTQMNLPNNVSLKSLQSELNLSSKTIKQSNLSINPYEQLIHSKFIPFINFIQKNYYFMKKQHNLDLQTFPTFIYQELFQNIEKLIFLVYQNVQIKNKQVFRQVKSFKSNKTHAIKKTNSYIDIQQNKRFIKSVQQWIQRQNPKKFKPSLIFKLFMPQYKSPLKQITQTTNIIFKSKYKIFNLIQHNSILNNLQKRNQLSNPSTSNFQNKSFQNEQKNIAIQQSSQKFRRQSLRKQTRKTSLITEQEQNIIKNKKSHSIQFKPNQSQQLKQRKMIRKQRLVSNSLQIKQTQKKQQFADKIFNSTLDPNMHKNMYSNKRASKLSPLGNRNSRRSMQINEQKIKSNRKSAFDSNKQAIESFKQNQNEFIYQITKIDLKTFLQQKEEKIKKEVIQCYQRIRKYCLIKTNNINLKQELRFLIKQKQTNRNTQSSYQQFINIQQKLQIQSDSQSIKFNISQGIKDLFSYEGKNKLKVLKKYRTNNHQLCVDKCILKSCIELMNLLDEFHRLNINYWKIQENMIIKTNKKNQNDRKTKNQLILKNQKQNTHQRYNNNPYQSYQYFYRPILNVWLYTEKFKIQRKYTTINNINHPLILKCKSHLLARPINKNQNNQKEVQQEQIVSCIYCQQKINKKKTRTSRNSNSMISINNLSSYLSSIEISNKIYQIHRQVSVIATMGSKLILNTKQNASQDMITNKFGYENNFSLQENCSKQRSGRTNTFVSKNNNTESNFNQKKQIYKEFKENLVITMKINGFYIPLLIKCPKIMQQIYLKKQ